MASFTVAICTHNRAKRLQAVLASLAAATPPATEWDVLVVLNDCTDESADVVRGFTALPVAMVAEERPGLSHARNAAAAHARGAFIVFIDDDVRVGPRFLSAYGDAFRRWPDADVFSGSILPVLEGSPPPWLIGALPAVGSAYAGQSVARDGAPIEAGRLPFGANYAIRRSVQLRFPYDPLLGRGPVDWLRGGEETAVLKAILAGGSSGHWVEDASVDHIIDAERQSLDYLWRYFEGYGIDVGIRERRRGRLRPQAVALDMVLAEIAYRYRRMVAPPEGWARAMVKAAVRRGKWKSRRLPVRP